MGGGDRAEALGANGDQKSDDPLCRWQGGSSFALMAGGSRLAAHWNGRLVTRLPGHRQAIQASSPHARPERARKRVEMVMISM
jgi:hypothetical protein